MEVLFWKIIRFALVGFSGALVDFGSTYLLKEKARINQYVANSMGFVLASLSNFALNKRWTFDNHSAEVFFQYTVYVCVALGGLVINMATLHTTHRRLGMGFYYAKAAATVAATGWNFTLNYFITFR